MYASKCILNLSYTGLSVLGVISNIIYVQNKCTKMKFAIRVKRNQIGSTLIL